MNKQTLRKFQKEHCKMLSEVLDFLSGLDLKFNVGITVETSNDPDEDFTIKEISNGQLIGYLAWKEELAMEDEEIETSTIDYPSIELWRLLNIADAILNSQEYEKKQRRINDRNNYKNNIN